MPEGNPILRYRYEDATSIRSALEKMADTNHKHGHVIFELMEDES